MWAVPASCVPGELGQSLALCCTGASSEQGTCSEFETPVIFQLCALISVSNSNSSTGNHLSGILFSKIESKSMKIKFQLSPPQCLD